MKIYYCVTSSFDDRGRMKASLTNQIESEEIPENSLYNAFEKDIYTDWFESKAEAIRFISEVNGEEPPAFNIWEEVMTIQRVSQEEMNKIIDLRVPLGLFLREEEQHHIWVAVDNSTRDAWTEAFWTEDSAKRWLMGYDEVPINE